MKKHLATHKDLLILVGTKHSMIFRVGVDGTHCLTRVPFTLDQGGEVLSSLLRSMTGSGTYARILISLELDSAYRDHRVRLPHGFPVVRLPSPTLLALAIGQHSQHDPPDVGRPEAESRPIPRYPALARL